MSKKHLTILIFHFICFSGFTQSWEQLGDVPFKRNSGLTGTYNGKAYLFEGYNESNQPNEDVWEYDPLQDSWTQLGNVPFQVYESSLGISVGDKFYIGLGIGASYNRELHVYDYESATWSDLPDAPIGFAFGIMQQSDNKLFMGLGRDENDLLNSWYSFDLSTNTWEQKSSCPSNDIHECFAFTLGNYIYVGGGHEENSWYRYSVDDDTWETINNSLGARHIGTSVQNGNIGYVIGGDKNAHSSDTDENEYIMSYDPIADSWYFVAESPDGNRILPMSFVIDEVLYYFGGDEAENAFFKPQTMWKWNLNNESTFTLDINQTKELGLYPNPSQEIVTLTSLPAEIFDGNNSYSYQIIDMNGRVLHYGKLTQNKINVKILPSGQYMINLIGNGHNYSTVFIKADK